MSYVLEALKKRESEENPDVAVSVSLSAERKRRNRLLTWLVSAALVVNAGLLFWLLLWPQLEQELGEELQQEPRQTATENSPANATTPPPPAAAAQAPQTTVPAAPQASVPAAAQTSVPAVPKKEAPVAPERQRVFLDKLPSDVRARFPGLAFSTHIYAEDKDLRAVVANGQRLMEGDSLRGVTVEEITESGVILGFERFLIEVPVAGYWE